MSSLALLASVLILSMHAQAAAPTLLASALLLSMLALDLESGGHVWGCCRGRLELRLAIVGTFFYPAPRHDAQEFEIGTLSIDRVC